VNWILNYNLQAYGKGNAADAQPITDAQPTVPVCHSLRQVLRLFV
jgi:hypothetical protein